MKEKYGKARFGDCIDGYVFYVFESFEENEEEEGKRRFLKQHEVNAIPYKRRFCVNGYFTGFCLKQNIKQAGYQKKQLPPCAQRI